MSQPEAGGAIDTSKDSPCRICFICEAFAGGVRKHLRQLIGHLTQFPERYKVSAIVGDRGESGLSEEIEGFRSKGVDVTIIESFQRAIGMKDLLAYRLVKRQLLKLKPHVVHTHSSKAGFLGRLAARACQVPWIIHTPHVFPFHWAHGLVGWLYLRLEIFAGKRCDRIVCVGPGQFEEAQRSGVVGEDKLVLIPNGVKVPPPISQEDKRKGREELKVAPASRIVGMVARLAPQKGVGTFLRAAGEVFRRRSGVVFVLVGGGPMESEVRRRVKDLGLSGDQVQILGHVEGAEELYPAFDLMVLSSLYEGLPYVLLEAMARGLPVIATDVMGSRDVISDGETGLLVDPGDHSGMATQVMSLLESNELRDRFGRAARIKVGADYSVEQFLASHKDLYALR